MANTNKEVVEILVRLFQDDPDLLELSMRGADDKDIKELLADKWGEEVTHHSDYSYQGKGDKCPKLWLNDKAEGKPIGATALCNAIRKTFNIPEFRGTLGMLIDKFVSVKMANPSCHKAICLVQQGAKFAAYFEDAIKAAKVLDVRPTIRNNIPKFDVLESEIEVVRQRLQQVYPVAIATVNPETKLHNIEVFPVLSSAEETSTEEVAPEVEETSTEDSTNVEESAPKVEETSTEESTPEGEETLTEDTTIEESTEEPLAEDTEDENELNILNLSPEQIEEKTAYLCERQTGYWEYLPDEIALVPSIEDRGNHKTILIEIQGRVEGTNPVKVQEIKKAILKGDWNWYGGHVLPQVVAETNKELLRQGLHVYYLVNGIKRRKACGDLGIPLKFFPIQITYGNRRDAEIKALTANQEHDPSARALAEERSEYTKRWAGICLLTAPENFSQSQVAQMCGVKAPAVTKWIKKIVENDNRYYAVEGAKIPDFEKEKFRITDEQMELLRLRKSGQIAVKVTRNGQTYEQETTSQRENTGRPSSSGRSGGFGGGSSSSTPLASTTNGSATTTADQATNDSASTPANGTTNGSATTTADQATNDSASTSTGETTNGSTTTTADQATNDSASTSTGETTNGSTTTTADQATNDSASTSTGETTNGSTPDEEASGDSTPPLKPGDPNLFPVGTKVMTVEGCRYSRIPDKILPVGEIGEVAYLDEDGYFVRFQALEIQSGFLPEEAIRKLTEEEVAALGAKPEEEEEEQEPTAEVPDSINKKLLEAISDNARLQVELAKAKEELQKFQALEEAFELVKKKLLTIQKAVRDFQQEEYSQKISKEEDYPLILCLETIEEQFAQETVPF